MIFERYLGLKYFVIGEYFSLEEYAKIWGIQNDFGQYKRFF